MVIKANEIVNSAVAKRIINTFKTTADRSLRFEFDAQFLSRQMPRESSPTRIHIQRACAICYK